ncbi:sulfotransferase [Vibrio splendidus]|uniref:sulfotransferase n=1 Tax=Vibrio splendidus TaxID=29497 RepID=UPI002235F756|nr:sulfotransferase [Vibrio splendidus]MCW4442355.1 sulfotransferase [Vibrio splendidus]
MNKQIVVLGMHRSGTSILSKVLINLGVDMGEGDSQGGISNIDGHNEDFDMLSINEEFLQILGASWHTPPEAALIEINKNHIQRAYADFVEGKSGLWGVKEPRLSLFVKYLDVHLDNPKYIYITRNSEQVEKSINVRDGIPTNECCLIKKQYDECIKSFLIDKKSLNITYERLLSEPEKTLTSICNYLDLEYDESAISHIKTSEQLESVKRKKLKELVIFLISKSIKEPRKIFKISNVKLVSKVFRRFRELFL